MKYILIIAISFFVISCSQSNNNTTNRAKTTTNTDYKPNPKSIELNNKALEITTFHRDDSTKVDSAIILLDQATELDSLYFLGYINKIQFLMINEDFTRLLETNKRIRELRPNQPYWIIQRGLLLELLGDIVQANYEYQKGIKEYENILYSKTDLSLEIEMEFAQSLVIANNFERAQNIIKKLKKENPDIEIWKDFKLLTKEEVLELVNNQRP